MAPFLLIDVARDETLARRAASGDDRAFTALVTRYGPRLERYCRSILRNDEDGNDAAQNTLTKALIALRTSGGPDRAVSPWLFRIAHNESISLLRRRREEVALDDSVPVSGAGLHEQAELRADVAALLDGVAALPPRARHALLLREFAGLDHKAVGQVLGISPGAARQAVCEARASLRRSRGASRPRRLVLGLPVVGSLWSWVSSFGAAGELASGGAVLGGKIAAAAAVIATSAPVVVQHAAPERSPSRPAARAASVAGGAAGTSGADAAGPEVGAAVPAVAPPVGAAPSLVRTSAPVDGGDRTDGDDRSGSDATGSRPRSPARTRERSGHRPARENDREAPAHRDGSDRGDGAEAAEDHHGWDSAAPPPRTRPARAEQAVAPAPTDSNPYPHRRQREHQQPGPQVQPAQPTPVVQPARTPEPEATPAPEPVPTSTTPTTTTPAPAPTPDE